MKHLQESERIAGLFAACKPMTSRQESAWQRFLETGIPDIRHEDWRYARLPELLSGFSFHPYSEDDLQLPEQEIPGEQYRTILLQDGFWPHEDVFVAPEGVQVKPLHKSLNELPSELPSHLSDGLTLLNEAMARNGIFIRVAARTQPKEILMIRDMTDSNPEDFHNSRIIIHVEKNASLTLAFSRTSVDGRAGSFTNQLWNIILDENAELRLMRLEESGNDAAVVASLNADIAQNARAYIYTGVLEGKFVRHNYRCALNGSGAVCELYGLHMPGENQYADAQVAMVHAAERTESMQQFSSMAAGNGQSVFAGRIQVCRDAQKISAYQHHRGMLLSDSAKVYTKPQLEIYADDVKCSHGATTGQLDEEALFYLRSRGISLASAKKLLLHAFCAAFTDKLPESEFTGHFVQSVAQKLESHD